jgi:hypothetical protein
MIRYLGKVNPNTYPQVIHDVLDPRHMIAVQGKLVEGVEEQDLCLVQYSIIPRSERALLTPDTWCDSLLGPRAGAFVQYTDFRSPVAAVRLKPLSGTWDFMVRELTSDEITLKEAEF